MGYTYMYTKFANFCSRISWIREIVVVVAEEKVELMRKVGAIYHKVLISEYWTIVVYGEVLLVIQATFNFLPNL